MSSIFSTLSWVCPQAIEKIDVAVVVKVAEGAAPLDDVEAGGDSGRPVD